MLGDDNPITIDTTLGREVEQLQDAGLTTDALAQIQATAIERAFFRLEPSVRAALRSTGAPPR